MLQTIHYNTSGKEISCIPSDRLQPRRNNTNCDEVFQAAYQTTYHSQPPCITWPTSVCLSSQPLHRGCDIHHFALSHHWCLCQNPVHRFLLSIQYHHPQRLMEKLLLVGLNAATCLWIRDFLTERPQSVRVRNNTSNSITLSTGSPQGFVLSLLLVTHDCASRHQGNQIVKFEDDNTVVGLIHKNEESMYREEV